MKPHIVTVEDLESFKQEVVIASDSSRGKRLTILVKFDKAIPGRQVGSRLIVRDTKLPQGQQIVMITWDLREAVTRYNELG